MTIFCYFGALKRSRCAQNGSRGHQAKGKDKGTKEYESGMKVALVWMSSDWTPMWTVFVDRLSVALLRT